MKTWRNSFLFIHLLVRFTKMLYKEKITKFPCTNQTRIIRKSSSASSISSPTISPLSGQGTHCADCWDPCYHPVPETYMPKNQHGTSTTFMSREQGVSRQKGHDRQGLRKISKSENNTPCSKRELRRLCLAWRRVLAQCFLRSCTGLLLPGDEIIVEYETRTNHMPRETELSLISSWIDTMWANLWKVGFTTFNTIGQIHQHSSHTLPPTFEVKLQYKIQIDSCADN